MNKKKKKRQKTIALNVRISCQPEKQASCCLCSNISEIRIINSFIYTRSLTFLQIILTAKIVENGQRTEKLKNFSVFVANIDIECHSINGTRI